MEIRPSDAYPWFWHDDVFAADRVNDVHLTIAERHMARSESPRETDKMKGASLPMIGPSAASGRFCIFLPRATWSCGVP